MAKLYQIKDKIYEVEKLELAHNQFNVMLVRFNEGDDMDVVAEFVDTLAYQLADEVEGVAIACPKNLSVELLSEGDMKSYGWKRIKRKK